MITISAVPTSKPAPNTVTFLRSFCAYKRRKSIRANEYLLKSLLKLIPNPFFRILIV